MKTVWGFVPQDNSGIQLHIKTKEGKALGKTEIITFLLDAIENIVGDERFKIEEKNA